MIRLWQNIVVQVNADWAKCIDPDNDNTGIVPLAFLELYLDEDEDEFGTKLSKNPVPTFLNVRNRTTLIGLICYTIFSLLFLGTHLLSTGVHLPLQNPLLYRRLHLHFLLWVGHHRLWKISCRFRAVHEYNSSVGNVRRSLASQRQKKCRTSSPPSAQ